MTTKSVNWVRAAGSCGYNIGDTPVMAAYVNGVGLFAWQTSGRPAGAKPWFNCVVTGQMTCGGETLEAAQASGVRVALRDGVTEADRRLSRKQFDALVADPTQLPRYTPE